jgi:3-oxoacyl-[acyl-carrier protein] reductase
MLPLCRLAYVDALMLTNVQRKGELAADGALAEAVALVTGGSRGIGLAIARRLGRMGAKLAICARHPSRLDSARQELAGVGVQALTAVADVTQAAEVAATLARVNTELGPIDILVNCAGLGIFGAFHERSELEWDTVLDTNLKSVFLMSRAVAPEMIRRRRGHIINISSLAGKNAFANGGLYCASKWGLMGLTQCMAEELRAHGIRVSAICPGSVATEFSAHAGRDRDKLLQPDDVAHAVTMILTEGPQCFISEILLRPTQKP